MSKYRWMNTAIATAATSTRDLPWSRGSRRARRKAAARARALAA